MVRVHSKRRWAHDPLALTSTLATLYEISISPVAMSVTVSTTKSIVSTDSE